MQLSKITAGPYQAQASRMSTHTLQNLENIDEKLFSESKLRHTHNTRRGTALSEFGDTWFNL